MRAPSRCPPHIAVAPITGRLKDEDSFVRAQAVRGLARFGTEFAEYLDDVDSDVRLAAAAAIARRGGPNVLDRLVDFAFAFDGAQRHQAGRLLLLVNPFAANARFIEALEDSDRRQLWRIAIEALGEVNRTGSDLANPYSAYITIRTGDSAIVFWGTPSFSTPQRPYLARAHGSLPRGLVYRPRQRNCLGGFVVAGGAGHFDRIRLRSSNSSWSISPRA